MAEGMIVSPVIEKSLNFVFSHTYQELRYLWKLKGNIQSLSREVTNLERRREEISLLIDAAKNNAEVIGPSVEEWMQEVEMMKKEVEEIIQVTRNEQMGCFFNRLNLKVRYSLSKKAATTTNEIGVIQAKGEFSRVGYPAPIGQRPFTSPLEVFSFESRLRVQERVMKALLDENISITAVCGMGGVGKTTMVKKIADEIKKYNHFDEVVMAVVSQDHDLIKVQQQLAEKLGQNIRETTLDARADRLHTRLMDQGKKILLIIDDLWKEIDLRAIGIPSEVERKGLTVLLTSRFSRVCSKMDVKEIIEVGVLTKKEAWVLFQKHANISDGDSDFLKGYPKKVGDKCQGLPLAIEIIGKTLKDNKNLSDWADAYLELKNAYVSDTSNNEIYSRIAWSVNYLESQRRALLLLCSLFPEDYEIEFEDLVRYAKGMQLFEGIEMMTQTRDRVERIIHELTDCYLLIACDKDCVKIHDVVRDTCLRIASEGDNVYMVSHSNLTEWPDKDTYESYTAISLVFDGLHYLPSRLKCSRLQFLTLSFHKNEITNIVTRFLQVTKNLRVFNINHSGIELPPKSLQTSTSLRTLNLHNCTLIGDLSTLLENLVKVEVLSFYDSRYQGKWPKEIAELCNLKSLDLRFKCGPEESFPTGILIHLKKLEELYLGVVLDMQLPKPESYEAIVEIGSLSKLNTIEILRCNSDDLLVLVENLDVERLSRFFISPTEDRRSPYQFNGTMIVHEANIDMLSEPKMKALLSKVEEYLELWWIRGYNNDLVKDFDGGSVFNRLSSLNLRFCQMKYLCNSTDSRTRAGVFVDLKELDIQSTEHLEELCHGDIPPGSFSRLETVTLKDVSQLSCLWGPIKPPSLGNLTSLTIHASVMLRSLFLGSSVKCFARLRLMNISDCPKLESLVSCNAQTEKYTVEGKAQFPELEELLLKHVNSFKTFFSEPEAPKVLLCRTNSNKPVFPKLRNLEIFNSEHLNVVDVTKNVQNISSLNIRMCPVEVCFDFEGWRKEIARGEVAEIVFHNLDSLFLEDLPNLRNLWRNLPEGTSAFQNLTTLTISACGSLKRLLTPSMAKTFVRLKTLNIYKCEELEAIVGSKEMGPLEDFSASILQEGTVALPKLVVLTISYCGSLKHLLTPSMAKMLVSPKTLDISSSEELEAIVESEEMGPLDNFSTSNCLELQEETVAFQNLVTLNISYCGSLKHLLTPSMAKMLVSLKTLEILSCEKLEAIVGSKEMGPLEDFSTSDCVVLQNLTTLDIFSCGSLKHLLTPSLAKMLVSLKNVVISSCDALEAIVGVEETSPWEKVSACKGEKIFNHLEQLTLRTLPQLTNFERIIPEGTVAFHKLLTLKIEECGGLRYLLTPPMGKLFASLKALKIESCDQMECIGGEEFVISLPGHKRPLRQVGREPNSLIKIIVSKEVDAASTSEAVCGEVDIMHNLVSLSLIHLPKIRHLWRNLPEGSVVFQNLTNLSIQYCGSLKYLLTPSMARMLVSLERLDIYFCEELEAIVGLEDDTSSSEKVSECIGERIFDRLEHLEMWGLPQLSDLGRMLPEGTLAFQNLQTLKIKDCRSFKYLLTPRMLKMLANLKKLKIGYCNQIESIIGSEQVDENEVDHDQEELVLPQLCKLKLKNLPEFKTLCFQSVDLAFPQWNEFVIDNCPRISSFSAGNLSTPELKQVRFKSSSYDKKVDICLDLETTRKLFKDCELGKHCMNCATSSAAGERCDHLSEGSSTNKLNVRGIQKLENQYPAIVDDAESGESWRRISASRRLGNRYPKIVEDDEPGESWQRTSASRRLGNRYPKIVEDDEPGESWQRTSVSRRLENRYPKIVEDDEPGESWRRISASRRLENLYPKVVEDDEPGQSWRRISASRRLENRYPKIIEDDEPGESWRRTSASRRLENRYPKIVEDSSASRRLENRYPKIVEDDEPGESWRRISASRRLENRYPKIVEDDEPGKRRQIISASRRLVRALGGESVLAEDF